MIYSWFLQAASSGSSMQFAIERGRRAARRGISVWWQRENKQRARRHHTRPAQSSLPQSINRLYCDNSVCQGTFHFHEYLLAELPQSPLPVPVRSSPPTSPSIDARALNAAGSCTSPRDWLTYGACVAVVELAPE